MRERSDPVIRVAHIEHPEDVGIGLVNLWSALGKGSLAPSDCPLESIPLKAPLNLLGQGFDQGSVGIGKGPGLAINSDITRLGYSREACTVILLLVLKRSIISICETIHIKADDLTTVCHYP